MFYWTNKFFALKPISTLLPLYLYTALRSRIQYKPIFILNFMKRQWLNMLMLCIIQNNILCEFWLVLGFPPKKIGYFQNIFFHLKWKLNLNQLNIFIFGLKFSLYLEGSCLLDYINKSEKPWTFSIKRKFLSKNFLTLRTKITVL